MGQAVNLGSNINSHLSEEGPRISNELELYFSSGERSGSWEFHTMRSVRTSKNDPWGPAAEYNGLVPDDVSSDGLTMYFTAWWDTGYGNRDIWTATRATTDDEWGNAVNLGPNVNDERYQSSPSISNDDLALFFNDEDGVFMRMSVRRTTDGNWGPGVDISAPLCPDHQKRFSPDISPDGRVLYSVHHDWGAFTERKVWQASIMPMVDFTGDGMVDLADLLEMIEHWDEDCAFYDVGPMPWGDGVVDEADLEVLMNHYGLPVDYSTATAFDVTPPHNPKPADGWATDVERALPLSWTPGGAVTAHDLYLGTDRGAVENANVSDTSGVYRGEQSDDSYMPPESVQQGQTYYWRIDEIEPMGEVQKGEIWSFTVADYLIVDDFESYSDDYDGETFAGTTIWNTWIDGFFTGTTGAIVGYYIAPFAETITVHRGLQAMPFWYDNDGTIGEGDADFEITGVPYYSETQRLWEEPQDWTKDAEVLSLWFYGDPGNAVEPFYVALEDSAGNRKEVAHPDPAAITVERWEQWAIPLVDFTGVDPTTIKMMGIGVGDPVSNQPGGTGLVRVDDIELHRSSGQ